MKITILVEGKTEQAFKPYLLQFLMSRLADRMPNVGFFPCQGRVYKEDKLRRTVEDLGRELPEADNRRCCDTSDKVAALLKGAGFDSTRVWIESLHHQWRPEDHFIADLAVGTGCCHLKTGAPARGERVAKYNRLLEIAAAVPALRYGMPVS